MKSICIKHRFFHRLKYAKGLWFHIAGILCLIWFAVRVIPRPYRSQYPCQQVAIPIALGYLAFWGILFHGVLHWTSTLKHKTAGLAPAFLLVILLISTFSGVGLAGNYYTGSLSYEPWDPIPNQPMGTPQGIHPGRVVWVWDPDATEKDLNGYWWESVNNDQEVITTMMAQGIQRLTNTEKVEDAWEQLFIYFNQQHEQGSNGYQPGEKIAIKINLNNCWNPVDFVDDYETEDNQRDAHPMVVTILLEQLIEDVGVAPSDITVYDASRPMPHWFYDRVADTYPTVNYKDMYGDAPGRSQVIPSDISFTFADGVVRTLPECVADADYLINMPLLKQHPINNGVTLSGKNLFGTFIEPVMDIHPYHESGQIVGNPAPQTDLLAYEHLGQKTVLYIGDGLYATLRDHRTITWFHMYPFNDDWTNSMFFSQDPVAIDSVMYDFLHTEGPVPIEGSQNYLHEAAVPTPETYDPENDGIYLSESLGVHEHWNTDEPVFSADRYVGASEQGIDFISLGEERADTAIVITKPAEDYLYAFDSLQYFRILFKDFYVYPFTIVFGPITVETSINGMLADEIDRVEFLIDGQQQFSATSAPYQWQWTQASMGFHTLTVRAIMDETTLVSEDRDLLKIL